MPELADEYIQRHVANAIAEDVGTGDATTNAIIDADQRSEAFMVAREGIILCGCSLAHEVFFQLDAECEIQQFHEDGHQVGEGNKILSITAKTRALLAGERTALNYVQRLSGISTMAALYVNEAKGSNSTILDTRKTTPGWRLLEKHAARCGGAQNHRLGLDDMIMIKDNHLASIDGSNRIARAIGLARARAPGLKIEVEADTVAQAKQAADAGADVILLDNMNESELCEAVSAINNRSQTEASGGIQLEDVRKTASTGVNFISVGAITHSAPAVDISLEIKR